MVPSSGGETAANRRNTVLLVDDDVTVRRLARRVLERLGYHVLEAEDVTRAIEIGSQYDGEIHLLVSDMVMPGMDGRALSREIRALRPGIATLFMSGYGAHQPDSPPDDVRGLHHIQKPFGIDTLALAVQSALADRGAA